ncbi:MAG: hypothetical protein ABIR58_05880, partial [Gemmatimonadaceae bacterium]
AVDAMDDGADMVLHGFVSDIIGRTFVRGSHRVDLESPEESGRALAAELRTRGATSLLMALRSAERVIAPQPE